MNQWNLVFLGVLISVLSIVVGAIAFRPIPLTAQTQPVAYEFCFFGRQDTPCQSRRRFFMVAFCGQENHLKAGRCAEVGHPYPSPAQAFGPIEQISDRRE